MTLLERVFAATLCLTLSLSLTAGANEGQGNKFGGGNNEKPAILSAYLGGIGEVLPPGALSGVTGCPQSRGDDGMPIELSVQIKASSLLPEHFRVISRAGAVSTPNCATLRPADDSNELTTILLAGPFVGLVGGNINPMDFPAYVLIVGPVRDINGNLLTGKISPPVTIGPQSGPSLVRASLFTKPGGPAGSSRRAIQMVWQGGVTGPFGAELGTNQLNAIRIIDRNGNAYTPLAFDDLGDGDNFFELYVPAGVVAERVEVEAGFFYDPMNFPNPATAVQVSRSNFGRDDE
jgi:hypothetical protein